MIYLYYDISPVSNDLQNSSFAHEMVYNFFVTQTNSDDSTIKLADFGFATRVYAPNSLTKQCGTPFFVGMYALFLHSLL